MATAKVPFNETQFVNSNLACNATDNASQTFVPRSYTPTGATPFYLTRTALNATTGQSENDTFLQM